MDQELAVAMNTGQKTTLNFKGAGANGEFLDEKGEIIYDDATSPNRLPFVPNLAASSEPAGRAPVTLLAPGKLKIASDDPGLADVTIDVGPFPDSSMKKVIVHVAIGNKGVGDLAVEAVVEDEDVEVAAQPGSGEGGGGS